MPLYKSVDLFGVPDELNLSEKKVQKKSPRKTKKGQPADSAVGLPGQGFLPGLSRRGRPRLAQPVSAVERTAEHRRKRIANGAKRVEIIVDSDVSRALDRLAQHHQEPKSDVIAMLIRKAASRLKT